MGKFFEKNGSLNWVLTDVVQNLNLWEVEVEGAL